MAGSVNSQRL